MISYGFGVSLGPLDSGLIEKIRVWRNNPQIFKWCRQWGQISDMEQARWFNRQSEDQSVKMYGVYLESDLIGVAGFTSIDLINRRAEFSLYIKPDLHGCGYGKSALQTLVTYGFKAMGLNSIWGETFDGNPAAKMFAKLGLNYDGTNRQAYWRDGKFIDAHRYSILRSEWRC